MDLGFGASGAWGMPWFRENKAQRVIQTAVECGVRHFDTAGFYCKGEAEPRLGRALAALADDSAMGQGLPLISTKVGKKLTGNGRIERDFSPDGIKASLALTRHSLQRKTLDIVYLHGPNEHEIASSLPVLLEAKAQNQVTAIGLCSDNHDQLSDFATHPDIDVLMGRFNLFNQENRIAFESAKAASKHVVAIAPLGQGLWRRDLFFPKTLSHAWYLARALVRTPDELKVARAATWLHEIEDWSPAELMLAFIRQNECIDTILTTSTNPQNIRSSAKALQREVPADVIDRFQSIQSL